MINKYLLTVSFCVLVPAAACWGVLSPAEYPAQTAVSQKDNPDRSPVDLVLTKDERWLVTANQTAHTVSLVDVSSGKVVCELPCGKRPSALALTPDEKMVVVAATYSGELRLFALQEGKLIPTGKVFLNYFEPRGVAIAPDGKLAYVALTTAHQIAVVDLAQQKVIDHIKVGRWPRYLALSPDGKRLAVGANGDGGVSIVDVASRKMAFQENFIGINIGQMHISADSKHVFFPWMVYLSNPINTVNIENGWVLANRIGRIDLHKQMFRQAMSLDPRRKATADPHGLAISPDGKWLVCSASGVGELLVFQVAGLPLEGHAGPGDVIHPDLQADKNRFDRIPLGGRPLFVRYAKDNRHVYVANYLLNAVQVVDVPARKVVRTIALGGPKQPSPARQGEAIFFDARRTLDHWFSCHTCHYEGHTNRVTMDTNNDGSIYTPKTVLSLRNVAKTPPWTWHGQKKSLEDAIHTSLTNTMQGKEPAENDLKAVAAYLDTLTLPPNPYRNIDGSLSAAAQRGEKIFQSKKAGCTRCHAGPYFTSNLAYDVGLGTKQDLYPGFNPPSLLGLHTRLLFLHDGRATSLEDVLRNWHNPAQVTGKGELSETELQDLLVYLKSL